MSPSTFFTLRCWGPVLLTDGFSFSPSVEVVDLVDPMASTVCRLTSGMIGLDSDFGKLSIIV